MARNTALAYKDERSVPRDEIHYRARGHRADGTPLALLIVNISAMGLMARCDESLAEGEQISVIMPRLGMLRAEVRWSLGGRIGCELAETIGLADYYELLAALLKLGHR